MQVTLNFKAIGRGFKKFFQLFKLNRLTKIALIVFCVTVTALLLDFALMPSSAVVAESSGCVECGFTYAPEVTEAMMMIGPKIHTCWMKREQGYIWQWQFAEKGAIGACVPPQEETEL